MRVGDLVRPLPSYTEPEESIEWIGIIVDWCKDDPIVFWCEEYPGEIEHKHQLERLDEKAP